MEKSNKSLYERTLTFHFVIGRFSKISTEKGKSFTSSYKVNIDNNKCNNKNRKSFKDVTCADINIFARE